MSKGYIWCDHCYSLGLSELPVVTSIFMAPGLCSAQCCLLVLEAVRTGSKCGLAGFRGCPSVLRREGAMSPGILGKGSLSLSEHPGGPPSLHSILIRKLAVFQSLVCTIITPEIMVRGSGVGPRFYVNPHSMVWDFENPGPAAREENHQLPDHSSLLSPALINSTDLSALCSLL